VVRRTGRGWPSILVLAFAYAVLEEAFTTQTLFNPNYLNLNLHLLQPAYIPALGIGIWWTVFVLTLHTVWSISVSIGLVEALVPDRATTPWLRGVGLTVTSIVLTLAVIATTAHQIKTSHFVASTAQFCVAALVCVVAIVAAFLLPARSAPRLSRSAPHPWVPTSCGGRHPVPPRRMERDASAGSGRGRSTGLRVARIHSASRGRRCRTQHSHRQRYFRGRIDCSSRRCRKAVGGIRVLNGRIRI
jgi:hypothetical protein